MELNEKLQELRRKKGLTQEELADHLFVSRTAISKWESGRGYPSIDSLKAISVYFGISVDELLSSNELLTIAEKETVQKQRRTCDLVFGLLDCFMGLLLFLPFFREKAAESVKSLPLLSLSEAALWLRVLYFIAVIGITLFGILTLALQGCNKDLWLKISRNLSLTLSFFATLLFTVSLQPYAAVFLFLFLTVKVLMLIKR